MELFHAPVELFGGVRGVTQVSDEVVGDFAVVFVVNLVFEAGPEVHGDGTDLYFDSDGDWPGGEEHGDIDDGVQAFVPVGFGVGNVVLDFADFHVCL